VRIWRKQTLLFSAHGSQGHAILHLEEYSSSNHNLKMASCVVAYSRLSSLADMAAADALSGFLGGWNP
jgi:hypothetical protein